MNFEPWMRQAIELALRGRGHVEPNPRVGAIALRDKECVGRGYHRYYGGPHAEVVALRGAVDTLVVTLEPCSSELGEAGKKTPPCTDAIVAAGVKTVVIGQHDPDPRHHGRGVAKLTAAGIEVIGPVLEAQCAALLQPFRRGLELEVPWVVAKWAMTLDGKTATGAGDSKWISSEASRTAVHQLRARVDGVVVGYRTALRDDPALTVRLVEGQNPVRIVIDPCAALPTDLCLVQTARQVPTWFLVGPEADRSKVQRLRAHGVEVRQAPGRSATRRLDLTTALRDLRKDGLRRLLLEGGGALAGELMEANLIHQVMAFIAPKLLGGADATTPVMGAGHAAIAEAWPLAEMFCEPVGADLLVHGFVVAD